VVSSFAPEDEEETRPRRRRWVTLLLFNLGSTLVLTPLLFVFSAVHTVRHLGEIFLLVAVIANVDFAALAFLERPAAQRSTLLHAAGHPADFERQKSGLEVQLQRLQAERDALLVERKGLQNDHNDSKLATLQATLKSHFIFNTLNAIVTLIQDDPQKAEDATLGLARVLRAILEMRDRPLIPLRAEIGILKEYVQIEKIRLGARMSFHVEAQEDVLDVPVPAMILQPLVENAIQHGICQRRDGGVIQLRAFADGNKLHLEVIDNGPGVSMYAGNGQAMTLIRERLANLYEDQSELRLERDPAKRETIVSAVIPTAPLRSA
jgi:LytS/YehU family sensor histidine kinase